MANYYPAAGKSTMSTKMAACDRDPVSRASMYQSTSKMPSMYQSMNRMPSMYQSMNKMPSMYQSVNRLPSMRTKSMMGRRNGLDSEEEPASKSFAIQTCKDTGVGDCPACLGTRTNCHESECQLCCEVKMCGPSYKNCPFNPDAGVQTDPICELLGSACQCADACADGGICTIGFRCENSGIRCRCVDEACNTSKHCLIIENEEACTFTQADCRCADKACSSVRSCVVLEEEDMCENIFNEYNNESGEFEYHSASYDAVGRHINPAGHLNDPDETIRRCHALCQSNLHTESDSEYDVSGTNEDESVYEGMSSMSGMLHQNLYGQVHHDKEASVDVSIEGSVEASEADSIVDSKKHDETIPHKNNVTDDKDKERSHTDVGHLETVKEVDEKTLIANEQQESDNAEIKDFNQAESNDPENSELNQEENNEKSVSNPEENEHELTINKHNPNNNKKSNSDLPQNDDASKIAPQHNHPSPSNNSIKDGYSNTVLPPTDLDTQVAKEHMVNVYKNQSDTMSDAESSIMHYQANPSTYNTAVPLTATYSYTRPVRSYCVSPIDLEPSGVMPDGTVISRYSINPSASRRSVKANPSMRMPSQLIPSMYEYEDTYRPKRAYCVDGPTMTASYDAIEMERVPSYSSRRHSAFDQESIGGPTGLPIFAPSTPLPVAPPVASVIQPPAPVILSHPPVILPKAKPKIGVQASKPHEIQYEVTLEQVPTTNGEASSRISIRANPIETKMISPSKTKHQKKVAIQNKPITKHVQTLSKEDINSICSRELNRNWSVELKTRPSTRHMPTLAELQKRKSHATSEHPPEKSIQKSLGTGALKPKSQVHFDIDISDSNMNRTIILKRSIQSQSNMNPD